MAGDLFDSQRVRPETIQALYQVLEELEAEVFLSPGNHDPYTKVSPTINSPGPATFTFSPPSPPSGWSCPSWGRGVRRSVYRLLSDGQPPGRAPRPGGRAGRLRLFPRRPRLGPQPLRPHPPERDRRVGPRLFGPGPPPHRQRPAPGGQNLVRLARLPGGAGL
ncbi:MAG: hypothetical protein ACLUNZ_05895 [Evtepia sp.]